MPREIRVYLEDILESIYFGVDLEIVWDVIQNKLPELKKEIENLMKNSVPLGHLP